MSLLVEDAGIDAKRIVAKAFWSAFPHLAIIGYADGFLLRQDGLVSALSAQDRGALY